MFKDLIIVSNENLSGDAIGFGFGHDIDRNVILKGIKAEYGNVKIILGVRDKESWLRSLYNKYCDYGFKSYSRWYNENFNKSFLDYNKYIFDIKEQFDNVYIYDYSLLKNDFPAFKKRLCIFLGYEVDFNNVNVNRSVNIFSIYLLRFVNFCREFLAHLINRYKKRGV